jgi:ABC-type proline/glycine betaine transport system permease subunit
MSSNLKFAMIFPILAIVTIATFAGGLGVVFMLINASEMEELGVIILGSAIVVVVPVVAYLLERRVSNA